MTIDKYFPTSIYYTPLSKKHNERYNKELVKECYKIREYDKAGQKWSKKNYPGGYTSYDSINNLHQFSSSFAELEKEIRKHVYKFAKHLDMDLQGKPLVMSDFWLNIMPHQVVHSLHLHPLSCISGTYYVKTPKNCSTIKFEDPRLSKFMAAPPRKASCAKENKQHVTYSPEAGKLVLFESWLRHEVAANQSKDDRISVSFNYQWN